MEYILECGEVILIDEEDLKLALSRNWRVGTDGYASFMNHVRVDGVRKGVYILLHRLITKAKKGKLVDHINGNRLDNRKENLRLGTHWLNAQNKKAHGAWCSRGRWTSAVKHNNERHLLGTFNTEQEAIDAYLAKKRELCGSAMQTFQSVT